LGRLRSEIGVLPPDRVSFGLKLAQARRAELGLKIARAPMKREYRQQQIDCCCVLHVVLNVVVNRGAARG
jgi:hypothetical protein